MIGNSTFGPGIMGLSMKELFEKIAASPDYIYDVSVSCLEVYNETIRQI